MTTAMGKGYRQSEAAHEGGFTVVELVVVVFLLGFVATMVFGFLSASTSVTTKQSRNEQAEQEAQFLMRRITSDLRSAYEISSTYPTTSTCASGGSFAAASGYAGYKTCLRLSILRPTTGGATCPRTDVTYGLASTRIAMDRVEYDGSCTAVRTTTTKVELNDVINGAGTPFFTYYDRAGNDLLSSSPVKNPATASSIKVTFVKRYQMRASEPLTFSAVVALRNKR